MTLTAFQIRQAVASVVTTQTTAGTANNSVSTIYFFRSDQIPFAQTPALVVTSPEDDEVFTTVGGGRSEGTVKVEVEYLDAPLVGDDLQQQMAAVELWFEQAKENMRRNPQGTVSNVRGWARLTRMRTVIDQPLIDQGRVLYHGTLYVWVKADLH